MNYYQALKEALLNRELVSHFDRLNGTNLSMKGEPINLMVDKKSGRLDADFQKFVEFFDEYIWQPVFNQFGYCQILTKQERQVLLHALQ